MSLLLAVPLVAWTCGLAVFAILCQEAALLAEVGDRGVNTEPTPTLSQALQQRAVGVALLMVFLSLLPGIMGGSAIHCTFFGTLGGLGMCAVTLHYGIKIRSWRSVQEMKDVQWIIRQRGSVQDQMMRACEREAMDRRLRRCQSTLMLTRRGGEDLTRLFQHLETRVADMSDRVHDAATTVSSFASHLRHVFMESDRDDIPLGEACMHVMRWARVLEQLGTPPIHITGVPAEHSMLYNQRIPALLLLGAVERIGVATLEAQDSQDLHWHWHITEESVMLESRGGGAMSIPEMELKDWDAAFMLRHGGIAHAGGMWTFELPMLPA